MSTAAAVNSTPGIRKVRGIIPVELQQMMDDETLNYDKAFYSMVNQLEKEQQKQEVREQKAKKKEDKNFGKIRDKMIENVFGVDSKTLRTFRDEDYSFRTGKNDVMTQAERVKNLRKVWLGQEGSNKNSWKDFVKETTKSVGVLGMSIFAAAKLAQLTEFAAWWPVAAVSLAATTGYKLYRWKKASKGNNADAHEKHRQYVEEAEALIKDVSILEEAIAKDRDLFLEKKKTMKKSDFNNWASEYILAKAKELGLEPNKDMRIKEDYENKLAPSVDEKTQEKPSKETAEQGV